VIPEQNLLLQRHTSTLWSVRLGDVIQCGGDLRSLLEMNWRTACSSRTQRLWTVLRRTRRQAHAQCRANFVNPFHYSMYPAFAMKCHSKQNKRAKNNINNNINRRQQIIAGGRQPLILSIVLKNWLRLCLL